MLIHGVMIIVCPACATRYAVPDSAIGIEGRTVRCAKCRHNWFQEGPSAEAMAASLDAIAPEVTASARQTEAAPADEGAIAVAVAHSPETSLVARYPKPTTEAPPATAQDATAEPAAAKPEQIAAKADAPPVPGLPPRVAADARMAEPLGDDDSSPFDYAPPFRRRRNWARIGTYAAAVFAVITFTLAGVVAWGGLPDWVPIPRPTFAQAQTDLVLDFPPKRQDRRTLPNGTEFFGASGTVSNIGRETRYVPTILIVLRDSQNRIVYTWEVVPPKRKLAPGETITINEAVTDVPKSARAAEIGWKPA